MEHSIFLRVLDQQVHIRTDSAPLAARLRRLYERFCTIPVSPSLEIIVGGDTAKSLAVQGRTNASLHLTLHNLPVDQQADILFKAIYAHIEKHLLFHAGVLALPSCGHKDKDCAAGVALVGPTGHGKTTLTLELARRGYGFLSDEVAALEVATGRLSPFPRALHPRPGTLERLGLSQPATQSPSWFDIDQLLPDRLSDAVPLRFLFLLESDRHTAETALWLSLSHVEPSLLAAFMQMTTVSRVEVDQTGHCVRLVGEDLTQNETYYQIEHICREQRCRILDLNVHKAAPPTFQALPRIAALSTADATLALLPHLQSGRRSRLWYGPWQGSPLALFRTLAMRLHNVTCFRLRVGQLKATADLVEESVNHHALQ
jgi:hypothetical protein